MLFFLKKFLCWENGVLQVGPKLLDLKFGEGLGIQTTRDTNISLIEKLMWDLLQRNNKFWVNILSHKYA